MNFEVEKGKITQIESLAETINFYLKEKNEDLSEEMEKLIQMIKEEKERQYKLSDIANYLSNKI